MNGSEFPMSSARFSYIKNAVLVIAGLCWLGFAAGFTLFLFQYLAGGAGLQVFGLRLPMSPATAWMGLVHFIGFASAAGLCLVVGIGLCVRGFVPAREREETRPDAFANK
jgi:hypothetical protein